MKKKTAKPALHRSLLGGAILLALAGPASAVEFSFGEGWSGTFDTTVSYGVSLRMEDPDPDLIGKANFNPLIGTPAFTNAQQRTAQGRFSVNSDDAAFNYPDKHDIFSKEPFRSILNMPVLMQCYRVRT